MFIKRLLLLITLSLVLVANNALAQSVTTAQGAQSSSPAVTASVSVEGTVRFTSPGQVTQIRLEIFNANGVWVYDSGMRQGSIIDWKITDATQPMTDGSYLSVVSVKDLQGKLRQRLGALSVQSGQITLQNTRAESLTADQSQALATRRQAQKIEAADNNDAITILREGKARAVTVTAHDGQDGQVTSTSGALTFRTGDIFSKQEKEQMRITADGQVGIGTDKPEATLDVAGTIRARGGIRFEDGTVLTSAQLPGHSVQDNKPTSSSNVTLTANAAGTGTTNSLVKWADGPTGTLGDASIVESGGNIGIGTTHPTAKLHVVSSQNLVSAASFQLDASTLFNDWTAVYPALELVNTNQTNNNVSLFQFSDTPSGASHAGIGAVNTNHTNKYGDLFFYTKQADGYQLRMGIYGGNVGIGTTTPTNKLEVAGNIKLSGAGHGIIFSDGSIMTTANSGGASMSGNSIVTAINDPSTTTSIGDNRLSGNIARLNGTNSFTGANSFSAGLSANGALITGVGNPVNGTDAANKGYVDSNFVKLNPAAPQVSVGDANGTAPMVSLRGGSTCCSGPGGFTAADFKIFQNGSFVATGNLGIGVSPMEGKGYRTSWYTYKGAFRSGYADNEWDDANTGFFSWAGGSNSTASGLYSFAFGDTNFASSTSSIAFGSGNEVKGAAGFSAGAGNRVCDTYGVAFGNKAQSGGPLINGRCDPDAFNITGLAAVAIGYNVTADKDHSTAMGKFASNNGFSGTFVWSDGSATASADTFKNTANNEFAARATGGFRFRTNLTGTTGCNLPAGSGVFNCTSSRYTKENFMMVSGEDVLSRLRKIQVSTWNYISEGGQVRHMGPMAEDFYQAFTLGTGNTSIGVQDLAGVSLAAVKALDMRTAQLQQKSAEVDKLRIEVDALRSANTAMEQRLAALEQNALKNTRTQKRAQGRRR
jgi:hypothetical protein